MTAAPKASRSPEGSGQRGGRLWRQVLGAYELTPSELVVLAECCRTLGLIERLDLELGRAPLMVTGSTGQLRVHPGVQEIRQHRALFGQLLRSLALPHLDVEALEVGELLDPGETSSKARKAARARWSPPEVG